MFVGSSGWYSCFGTEDDDDDNDEVTVCSLGSRVKYICIRCLGGRTVTNVAQDRLESSPFEMSGI